MADHKDLGADANRQARLARVRARRRAADQADAGLFLQQTIMADLLSRGEVGPDESVEVTRGTDGGLVVRLVKGEGEAAAQPKESASLLEAGQGLVQEFGRWLAQLVTPPWVVPGGIRLANAAGNLTRFRFDLSLVAPGWEVWGNLSLSDRTGTLTLEVTTNDRSPRGWVVEFVAPDHSHLLGSYRLGHVTPDRAQAFTLTPRMVGFDPRQQPFLLLVRPATTHDKR
jgi:hypothetical protein